jgi:hypothetical protein
MADEQGALAAASDIGDLLRLLADTPGRLEALSRGMGDDRLQRPQNEGAWSANEILAHLRACADVWGDSIRSMIECDRPKLRYVSPRTWIRKTSYTSQPFSESLRELTIQRNDLVRALSALDPADWARGATFTGTTRGREQTILSYVRRIVAHELEHCEQVEATLKAS